MHQTEVKLQKNKIGKGKYKYIITKLVLPKQILKYAPEIKKAKKAVLEVDLFRNIIIKNPKLLKL